MYTMLGRNRSKRPLFASRAQAEFCFTVEGNDKAPALISLRGLDAALYYRPGSSLLNLAQPSVSTLVLDSLRYWVSEFKLDGFCLLSAEAMAQDTAGFVLDCPPIAQALASDPVLRACKLVAWPRDNTLLPRGGRRGFPHQAALLQHNDKFGSVLSWLQACDTAGLDAVASQLTGASTPGCILQPRITSSSAAQLCSRTTI
jgi:pullulanase/glycogen debranching enzyme